MQKAMGMLPTNTSTPDEFPAKETVSPFSTDGYRNASRSDSDLSRAMKLVKFDAVGFAIVNRDSIGVPRNTATLRSYMRKWTYFMDLFDYMFPCPDADTIFARYASLEAWGDEAFWDFLGQQIRGQSFVTFCSVWFAMISVEGRPRDFFKHACYMASREAQRDLDMFYIRHFMGRSWGSNLSNFAVRAETSKRKTNLEAWIMALQQNAKKFRETHLSELRTAQVMPA
jgi:hypothetical protein